MEIIPDSRSSSTYTPDHPLTLEFKSPKGIISLHSKMEQGLGAVIITTNSGKPVSIYATSMDVRDAADLLKKFMAVNKQQIVTGQIHQVVEILDTNCMLISVALNDVNVDDEGYYVSYMTVNPYHPREVKPLQQSVGPRTSDTGATLTVVSDIDAPMSKTN